MTKPWLVKVGVLFIKKRGCIVLTHPLFVYHLTESLVGVSRIDQDHMRPLLVVLSDKVVHEERLPDGPSTNLLRLVVTPFLIGRSEMSMCSGFPLMRSAILIPNGEGESI